MAEGEGIQLPPYSALFPKPLTPLGDMPILELLLRRLKAIGVQEFILAANHLRHPIEAYFGDGSRLGIRLYYSSEDKPSGAAGALGSMLDRLDETFFLTNTDLLTTIDLTRMALTHISEGADASIGICQREKKIELGVVELDTENRLLAYREKASSKYYVSLGIYILQREAVRPHVPVTDYLDIPNLLLKIQANNGSVVCFEDDCIWLDAARRNDFALAVRGDRCVAPS